MDDQSRLFKPLHPDSHSLVPIPLAGNATTPPPDVARAVPLDEGHGSSCECLACRQAKAPPPGGGFQVGGTYHGVNYLARPTLAGSPTKPVTAGSVGCTHPTERPSQPLPSEGGTGQAKGLADQNTSLDTLESSVNFLSNLPLPPETKLDETSLCSCFRHSGWAPARKKVFEALVRTGQTATRVAAFAKCGAAAWVKRSNVTETGVDGKIRNKFAIQGDHCHDRLCTPCANLRSMVIRDKLMAIIGEKPVTFITLTLAGQDDGLVEKVDRLYKHFRALRLHPVWAERVSGGAAFLEVKWSDKARRWHPHLHIICETKFIPQQELCDAWRSITKDSWIVDIRAVREKNVTASYVCKYASKPMNTSFSNDAGLLQEAVMALKGRRLCLTFGEWYGTPLTHAEDEELGDDLTDAAGYHTYMPLEQVLREALTGNAECMDIVRCLNIYDRFVKVAAAQGLPQPPSG